MFLDGNIPRLFKILDGKAEEMAATYIGEKAAFEHFQQIRHGKEIDPIPKAVENFMFSSRVPNVPQAASNNTYFMLRLFLQRGERDVGGWAVPYVLSLEGANMCGYTHAVSDPMLDKATPGAIVPHGTAEEGGYGQSVTELGDLEGMVIYYRQAPGGLVLIREAQGYRTVQIDGTPTEFRKKALEVAGRPVDIFFSEAPLGLPESVTIVRDEYGQPAMAIAKRGDDFSFSVLNVATPFRAKAELDWKDEQKELNGMTVQNLTLMLADDKNSVDLQLSSDSKVVGQSTLNADEIDSLIVGLGQFRAALNQQVRSEPDQGAGAREFLVVDPAWRTNQSPHADVDGVVMRLRHLGFGWVSFLLPRREARALGKWLTESSAESENSKQDELR